MVNDVTDGTFEKEVLESTMPVVVDFWASWCGPCKMLTPILEELSTELEGKIKVVKINIDDNPNTPSKFGIRSIPTMILFENGKNVATKMGALPKDTIKEWINSSVKV
ncbi:thioredoxin [Candidatus Tisiphia endosymbiont of Beris chalybata]|uniref:thioredoxin n=1 Tax=Candidatus Tisiphia endosymbiont of Beris chalybata TaxID=3066262 RepID=UPI00312CBEC4